MKEGIDLIDVLRRIWVRRRLVVLVTVCAMVLGVVVALVSPKRYTATCIMVPQTGETGSNAVSGLAAMAGVNLGAGKTGDLLSPTVYPQIVKSMPFQRELMMMLVYSEEHGGEVTLLDYLVKPDEKPDVEWTGEIDKLTRREGACRGRLSKSVKLTLNKHDDDIRLTATMPEALVAAQVAKKAQGLLQKYITEYKVQKLQSTLDFVEQRAEEARGEFERRQDAFALFRDSNHNIATATALIESQRLQNEYDLAFSLYSDLAHQREKTRIKLKETTPVFTIIEPVTVPGFRSAPKRKLIVASSMVFGFVLGCVLVFIFPLKRAQ